MLSKKDFIEVDVFQVFSSFSGTLVRFSIKIDVFALTSTKSLCLVLLRRDETSLMLWLYGNSCSFWQTHFTKMNNAVGLQEYRAVSIPN